MAIRFYRSFRLGFLRVISAVAFLCIVLYFVVNGGILYAKSMQYTLDKNFATKLNVSAEDKNAEVIGGYAKYRVSLYVASQDDINTIKHKQQEITTIIEDSVSKFSASQLQAHSDRRMLEAEITKNINEKLGKSFIKATFFVNMVVVPDMNYKP